MPTKIEVIIDDGIVGGSSSLLYDKPWVLALRGCRFQTIERDGELISSATVHADSVFLSAEDAEEKSVVSVHPVVDGAVQRVAEEYLNIFEKESEETEGQIHVLALKLRRMMGHLTGSPEPKQEEVRGYLQSLITRQKKSVSEQLKAIFLLMAQRKISEQLEKNALHDIPRKEDDD